MREKELRGWYNTHMLRAYKGEEFNEEKFQLETKVLFTKFAGDNAPEKYMLEKLKENEEYARFVDDRDAFVSFIAHEIELGKDSVVRGLGLFYGVEFDYVREFVNKNLKGNVV